MHPGTKKAGETMKQSYEPLLKAIEAYLEKADEDLTEMLEDEGRAESEESVDAINSIEEGIEDALTAETKRIINAIKKHKTLDTLVAAGAIDEIFDSNTCSNKIKKLVSKEINALIPKLVQGYVGFIDAELKITAVSDRTIAWIDDWSAQLAEIMKLTDKETITKIIQDGFAEGGDIASVTAAIKDSGIRNEYYRARRAALTEVLRAHNVSRQEASMQNPAVTGKTWRHTGAHKNEPRENHVAMDGQTVDVDKPFTLTGMDGTTYYPMFPVDPDLPPEEAVNCHCLSQEVVDENILGLSLEERQQLHQEALDSMNEDWEQELNERNKAKAGIEEDE